MNSERVHHNREVLGRALSLLQHGLIPFVETHLQRKFGAPWVAELNKNRAAHNRLDLDTAGNVLWDTQRLLHLLQARESREIFGSAISWKQRGIATDLLNLRNKYAHESVRGEGISDKDIDRGLDKMGELLGDLGARQEATRISEMRDQFLTAVYGGKNVGEKKALEISQAERSPSSQTSSHNDGAASAGNSAKSNSPPDSTGPEIKPAVGRVYFPTVGPAGSTMNFLRCQSIPMGTKISGTMSILGAVTDLAAVELAFSEGRAGEKDGAKRNEPIDVKFCEPKFLGESFGLALAVADKAIRYELQTRFNGRVLIATGAMRKGGEGVVGKIDGFEKKLELLLRTAPENSLFLYPDENHVEATTKERELLNQLQSGKRITTTRVKTLEDLNFLWKVNPYLPILEQATPKREKPNLFTTPRPNPPPTQESHSTASPGLKKSGGLKKIILYGVGAAAFALYVVSDRSKEWQKQLPNPTTVEQSDVRAARIVDAAAKIDRSSPQPAECKKLADIVDVARIPPGSVTPAVEEATAVAKKCVERLKASDARLKALRDRALIGSRDQGVSAFQSLAKADAALQPFDRKRTDIDEFDSAIAAGADAAKRIAESDKRIDQATAIVKRIRDHMVTPELVEDLASARDALTEFDRSRLTDQTKRELEIAVQAVDAAKQSDLRLLAFATAIRVAETKPSTESRRRALDTYAALTKQDRERALDDQRKLIDSAENTMSGYRRAELTDAAAAYQEGRNDADYSRLVDAVEAILPSDRNKMSDRESAAYNFGQEARTDIRASDRRIKAWTTEWQLFTAQLGRTDVATLFEVVSGSAKQLNDFDRGRLTPAQRLQVELVEQGAQLSAGEAQTYVALGLATQLYSSERTEPSRYRVRALLDAIPQKVRNKASPIQRELLEKAQRISTGLSSGRTDTDPLPLPGLIGRP